MAMKDPETEKQGEKRPDEAGKQGGGMPQQKPGIGEQKPKPEQTPQR